MPTTVTSRTNARHAGGLATLLLIATACATTQELRIQAYPGPPRPAAQVASLQTEVDRFAQRYTIVKGVDAVPLERRTVNARQDIALLPGIHTIQANFVEGGRFSASGLIPFEARAGGRYEVRAIELKDGLWPHLGKVAFGGSGRAAIWVVDLDTSTLVGGSKPRQDLFVAESEGLERPRQPLRFGPTDPANADGP